MGEAKPTEWAMWNERHLDLIIIIIVYLLIHLGHLTHTLFIMMMMYDDNMIPQGFCICMRLNADEGALDKQVSCMLQTNYISFWPTKCS